MKAVWRRYVLDAVKLLLVNAANFFSRSQQRLAGNPEGLLAVHFRCCWVYVKSKFVQVLWVNLTDLKEVPRLLNRISYSFLNCLTHCGRVTQICVFNTVKLGTSASSP